jgi:ABC-2 type transport system ATP-binding protein
MASVLEITEVDQYFRVGFWMKKIQVLHQVALHVPERSVFGFLGANGAGKTTLIHLITGLRKPSRGSVQVFGKPADSPLAKLKIGYLPERPYFHEHLTGEGLLRYFGVLSGMSNSKIKSRIPQVLSWVGMKEARQIELRKYSKGMLQRIGIAQALIHDPEFLVLDEPMSGLDPLGRKEVRELIASLASEGRTVFFSSHVIPDVESICNQVALIQKGRILGCGPIEQLLNSQGSIQTEIAFSRLDLSLCKDWKEFQSLKVIPNGVKGIVSGQEDTDQALRKLLQTQAQVLWIQPQRSSLESLFQKEIK